MKKLRQTVFSHVHVGWKMAISMLQERRHKIDFQSDRGINAPTYVISILIHIEQ